MASYSQVSLGQFIAQVSTQLDDVGGVYWTASEIASATSEALLVWGAYTNYWRARGTWTLRPTNGPWYDLSTLLPALRSRVWTVGQIVRDIQWALLENPSGVSGAGMSGQTSVGAILNAIGRARNRFVLDTRLPLSVHANFVSPPPPDGLVAFAQSSVFVHRAAWQDQPAGGASGGVWTNLWREDEWSLDHADPEWTTTPSAPRSYSEASLAPLSIQLSPAPVNQGTLEAVTVDSLAPGSTDAATLGVPDEWAHALKWGALSDLLVSESQLNDPLRAQYADQRYQQAVGFARDARSVFRVLVNGLPVPVDTLSALDAGNWAWRNSPGGPPTVVGALYDLLAIPPVDAAYGTAADVSQSAPLPGSFVAFMPVGYEDLNTLLGYVCHILTFKCGGKDFTSTLQGYDAFLRAVAGRKGVNAAKVRYLEPLFAQPQREWARRPDRVEVNA